jgi:MerR family transcriptional regulator, light-induced transcriptional regulator
MVREEHIDFPDLERYSDTPLFNTKAVVQQTGVPAPTLRAWERRYTILSPHRTNNAYRLYSERDIARIRWLKARVDAGMTISQAIALLHHMESEHRQFREARAGLMSSGNTSLFQIALPLSGTEESLPTGESEDHEVEETMGVKKSVPHSSSSGVSQIREEEGQDAYASTHSMRVARQRLLEAFKMFDEEEASTVMASMLAIYPVEEICAGLIKPSLWHIGELWEEGLITVSVEHFASAFFRGLLTNLLHVSAGPHSGPLVIACCAPGEAHELAPLMLALLLRRSGMRVIYLGQSIEIAGLLHTIRQVSPALICVSLSMLSFEQGLIDLARLILEMPAPRPVLAFGGQVFEEHPHLISDIPGVYLDGDLPSIVTHLKDLALGSPGAKSIRE